MLTEDTTNTVDLQSYQDVVNLFRQVADRSISSGVLDTIKANKMARLAKTDLIKMGVCAINTDCPDGTCVLVEGADDKFNEERKYCKCTSANTVG